MRQWPRQRAPEQIGRRGDDAACGKFVGQRLDVGVDAVHRRGQHDRRHRPVGLGRHQIAIEFAAFAGADFDGLS
jgi:hypothetical protein